MPSVGCAYPISAFYLRQLRLLAKIILLYPLQEPQVGCSVFDLARTLVGCYLSLLAPTLHISAPEHFKCFVLADELWVVGILLEQMHDPCGHIIEERRILDAHVREVEVVHYPLIYGLCVYLFAPFINGFEPVVGLAPTPKEHTHCGKHGKAKHLVEEEMQENESTVSSCSSPRRKSTPTLPMRARMAMRKIEIAFFISCLIL